MTNPSEDYRPADGTEAQAGAQAGVQAGAQATARPAWYTDVDDLREIADRLRKHIEARRWSEVASLLALDQVWAFDRPLPLAEGVAALAAVLGDAVDIHLWVEKILKAQAADGAGHLTLNCCLMWGERGNFKDHEVELDLHLGFGRDAAGRWAFRYLGVTAGTPERVPFPQERREAGQDVAAAGRGAAAAGRAAAPGTAAGALALAGAAPLAVPPGQVLAYLPVLVPAAALAAAAAPPSPAAGPTEPTPPLEPTEPTPPLEPLPPIPPAAPR
jgi:hypothetical protein